MMYIDWKLSSFQKEQPYLGSFIRPPIDNLRRCIEGAATEGLEKPILLEDIGEAKVCNLGGKPGCSTHYYF